MSGQPDALGRGIARLLEAGTWLASTVVAVGLFLLPHPSITRAGIALFISLPILRVLVMFTAFVRRRDRWGIVIGGLVLTILAVGIVLGATA